MFGLSSTILAAWTVQAAFGQSSIRSVSNNQSRKLYEIIGGYTPGSKVTDHNALDLDQKFMELELAKKTDTGLINAKAIYEKGGNSKSYAELELTELITVEIAEDLPVEGIAIDDNVVTGTVYKTAGTNQKIVKVQYDTSQNQDVYVRCRVGALDEGRLDQGCFKNSGTVKIGGKDYTYKYEPDSANKNARTLQGFSLQAEKKMNDCGDGCPMPDALMAATYYGHWDYGDKWIQAAFDNQPTSFSNGDADFSGYTTIEARIEAIKKGTVLMNVWMYVVREFEDAINDCKSDCALGTNCNDDPVHAWDEGVAFYTGSLEGVDGRASGKMLHQLADKRCINYKTCGINGDLGAATTSYVNHELQRLFSTGKQQLLDGRCTEGKVTLKQVIQKMYVPLIQGTLRYAYKVGTLGGGSKEKAEGAVFAASVLPRIHHTNPSAAATVYENMKYGSTTTTFASVKTAIESVYADIGVKCSDIGGLLDSNGAYYTGAEPCENDKSNDDGVTSGSDDKSNDDGTKSGEDDKSNDDGATSGSDDKSNDDGDKSGEDDKSNDDGAKSGEDDKSNDDGDKSGSDDSHAFAPNSVIATLFACGMIMWNIV